MTLTEGPTPQANGESAGSADGGVKSSRIGCRSVQWWPTLAGIAFAAFVALDLFRGGEDGNDLASIVAASGLVYLAAAALRKPAAAWLMFFASVVVITAAKVGLTDFDATWVLLAVAALFAGYGLLRGATHPLGGLPLQTIAMIILGAVAATALLVNEIVGACLVAAGLLAHAAWDVYHHWTTVTAAQPIAPVRRYPNRRKASDIRPTMPIRFEGRRR